MLRIVKIVDLSDGLIVDADFTPCGVCYITRRDEVSSLVVNTEVWKSWIAKEWPFARHVRWLSNDKVAVWHLPGQADAGFFVRAFCKGESYEFPRASPRDLLVGDGITFWAYGEQAYLVAGEEEVESQLVAVFDKDGNFLFGLRECLQQGDCDNAIEMDVGCVLDTNEALFRLYPSLDLWSIVPAAKSITRIRLPAAMHELSAVSATSSKIYFAVMRSEGVLLGSMDRQSSEVTEEGTISFNSLDVLDRSNFRIRGCGSAMLVISGGSSWVISFD